MRGVDKSDLDGCRPVVGHYPEVTVPVTEDRVGAIVTVANTVKSFRLGRIISIAAKFMLIVVVVSNLK